MDTTTVELTTKDEATLLDLADTSVRVGLDEGRHPTVDITALSPVLQAELGTFATLHVAGVLNGCIGTIDPVEPLAEAVSRLAWEAAFRDPRLPELTWADYPELGITISVLSPLEALPPMTEDQLAASLRVGVDGLLIAAAGRRATFLPAVWQQLPDPRMFLSQLQHKAGLPPGFWPSDARAWRYTAHEFGRGH